MVLGSQAVFHVAVTGPELQLRGQFWELLIKFIGFFQVFLIELLSEVLVHLALLDDLLVNFSLGLRSIILGLFLFFIEPCEVELIVHLLELFIILVRSKVDVIELLQVRDLLPPMGESLSRLVLEQSEFGGSFRDLEHLVGAFGLHETLLGVAYLLDLPALGLRQLVGELVEGRGHRPALRLLQQLRV